MLVFDIENNDKRQEFLEVITKTNWKKHDAKIHKFNDDFDYVYISGSDIKPIGLFNIFKNFNGKIIIFDNETILKKKSLITILEGAICSSPDTGSKWTIWFDGQKEFIFNGAVLILTNQEKGKFIKKEKYKFLTRDMLKV